MPSAGADVWKLYVWRRLTEQKRPLSALRLCLPAMSKLGSFADIPTISLSVQVNWRKSDYPPARHTRGKQVSNAMDGKLRTIPGVWISATHTGMTALGNVAQVI